ncbi:MAG TPA: hypothetical protein DDY23_00420, partial [Lachnospiraceae bacterium]|nr:hypothetical protein [Lachnospiraceae bacterium]
FKTYTSLYHSLTQADLDFLIFVQRNKIDSALCNLLIKKPETSGFSPPSVPVFHTIPIFY